MTAVEAITLGLSALGTVSGMQAASSQKKAQAAQLAHSQEQVNLQQRIRERNLERERRKAEAEARVRLGASGVSSTGGSGAAVISGLNRSFDEQLSDGRAVFTQSQSAPVSLLDDRTPAIQGLVGIGKQIASVLPD